MVKVTILPKGVKSKIGSGRRSTRNPKLRRRRGRNPYRKIIVQPDLAMAIRKIAHIGEEHKYVRETILDSTASGYSNFNSVIQNANDWYRCLPLVRQGATSATKIGKHIMPTKLIGHWNFRYASDDSNTRDIFVVMYILSSKSQKAYAGYGSDPTAKNRTFAGYSNFLDTGDGVTDSTFDGTWNTSTLLTNADNVTLIKKYVFKLSKQSGLTNVTGVVGQYNGNGSGMYSIPHLSRRITYRFPKPPQLKYDQSSVSLPQNYATWWAAGYYYADGTNADTGGGVLKVDMTTELHYTDA